MKDVSVSSDWYEEIIQKYTDLQSDYKRLHEEYMSLMTKYGKLLEIGKNFIEALM